MSQVVITIEGPDNCGKTQIAHKLSQDLSIPYFKVSTEKENWKNNSFKQSLSFDMLLPQFARQTGVSFIGDRGYASEWVYSKVFGRETDDSLLQQIDEEWAKLGMTHIICLRRDYSNDSIDDLVPANKFQELHDKYLEFTEWTKTDVVGLYVDDFKLPSVQCFSGGEQFNYDIDGQTKEIYAALEAFRVKNKYPKVYDLIKNGDI